MNEMPMTERIARALREIDRRYAPGPWGSWEQTRPDRRQRYMERAKAALGAMQGATDATVDETEDTMYPLDIWQAARPAAHGDYFSEYRHAMAIAALILAERERCAACCHTALGDNFVMMGPAGIARQIENAIRRGTP